MGAHGQSLAIPLFCSFLFTLFPCSSVGSFRKKPLQHGSFPQASVPSGSIHLLRSVGCSVGCGMDICPGVVLFMGCREIPAPQWSGGWQHLPLPTGLVLTLSLTPHCQVALGPFLNRLSQGTGSSEGLMCAPRGAAAEPVVSGMGEGLSSQRLPLQPSRQHLATYTQYGYLLIFHLSLIRKQCSASSEI